MRKFVARLNLDHYRERLAVETGKEKQKLIEQLLAQEGELGCESEESRPRDRLAGPPSPMRWS